ncbi:hypothetical protein [Pelistega ratti]|uniref:hypothetical protein n=1 Tax=Pelistega ratti TaxID=2652177 RepID=UPI00135838A7|nr:hypothetical protein [Pelistega ratti]
MEYLKNLVIGFIIPIVLTIFVVRGVSFILYGSKSDIDIRVRGRKFMEMVLCGLVLGGFHGLSKKFHLIKDVFPFF